MTDEVPGYFRVTRSATYGFLAALPLLLLYEVMIVVSNRAGSSVRVGAEVWLKEPFRNLGPSWAVLVGGLVIAIGIAIMYAERDKKLPLKPSFFGLIVAESAVYAVVVALIVSQLVGAILNPTMIALIAQPPQSSGLFTNIALSIGAGLYEELLFRVLLVGGLFWLLRRVAGKEGVAYVLAAVLGALAFSWVHYIGPLGDAFSMGSFLFRFLFGLALNVIYLVRGFGVAAWTHALYDVFVVTHLFG